MGTEVGVPHLQGPVTMCRVPAQVLLSSLKGTCPPWLPWDKADSDLGKGHCSFLLGGDQVAMI